MEEKRRVISDESFGLIGSIDRHIKAHDARPVGIAMLMKYYDGIVESNEVNLDIPDGVPLTIFGIPVKILPNTMEIYMGANIGAFVVYNRHIWDMIGDYDGKNSESKKI